MSIYQQQLERNIVKYSWFKIFTKRVYLPLIGIQLVNVGRVTVEELALIAVMTSVFAVALHLPTGYLLFAGVLFGIGLFLWLLMFVEHARRVRPA